MVIAAVAMNKSARSQDYSFPSGIFGIELVVNDRLMTLFTGPPPPLSVN